MVPKEEGMDAMRDINLSDFVINKDWGEYKDVDDGRESYGITFDAFCEKLGLNPICTDGCELVFTAQDLKQMKNVIWQDTAKNIEARARPEDGFWCGNCGFAGVVEEDDSDDDYPTYDELAEYRPRFCPNCGARMNYTHGE